MAKSKKRFFVYGFLLIILIGIFYLLFNDRGLIKYFRMQNELDSLTEQVTNLEKENANLKNEIDSLKNKIPAKIEQTAREKYDMLKEGEMKIEVKENTDKTGMKNSSHTKK
ncbi:cell division protein FtsB [bacterium BMS3Abin03]|nr:cell division protein FtsB [bacterium BMS3Abin03]